MKRDRNHPSVTIWSFWCALPRPCFSRVCCGLHVHPIYPVFSLNMNEQLLEQTLKFTSLNVAPIKSSLATVCFSFALAMKQVARVLSISKGGLGSKQPHMSWMAPALRLRTCLLSEICFRIQSTSRSVGLGFRCECERMWQKRCSNIRHD